MSLRTRLLIFSIILALIPLGIAGHQLIRITRDELKSSVNDSLTLTVSQIALDIKDFYAYTWLAPIQLIKKTIENKELGVNEKVTLLTESMKNIPDFVAFQIAVEGILSPMLVIQDDFANRLHKTSLDPFGIPETIFRQSAGMATQDQVVTGDITYIDRIDAWLIAIIFPLNEETFGRPARLSALIDLKRLQNRIVTHPFQEIGSLILIDAHGRKLFDKSRTDLRQYQIVEDAVRLLGSGYRAVSVAPYRRPSGEKMLAAYAFPSGLNVAVIAEQDETNAYKPVIRMERHLRLWILAGVLIAAAGAIAVSVSLTRPLRRLTKAARQISQGNLSVCIEGGSSRDEIGELSATFNKMLEDLRRYIDELTETTKSKERVESELQMAKTIQQSFLPKDFPEIEGIEVFGKCEPAREVGGDYFDFFQINEDWCGIVIGDVSGKGMPAALYMAVSRTLFRILSAKAHSPDQVLTEFNDQLVALNQSANMFITLFYGMLELKTGRLCYSVAGHDMPYILSSRNGNSITSLPQMRTMVAGIMDGIPMPLSEIKISHGDMIVLYTDGMTEAVNDKNEIFGKERLEVLLNQHTELSPKLLCDRLIQDVLAFQTGRTPYDDMTVVALKIS